MHELNNERINGGRWKERTLCLLYANDFLFGESEESLRIVLGFIRGVSKEEFGT